MAVCAWKGRDALRSVLEQIYRVLLEDRLLKISKLSHGRVLMDVQQSPLVRFFELLDKHRGVERGGEKELKQRESCVLTALEKTCQVQMKNREIKITQSSTDGRILLEVSQDVLCNFHDRLDNTEVGLMVSGQRPTVAELSAAQNTPAVCETNKEVDLESSLKTERALTRQLKIQLSDMKDFLQQQSSVHRVQMEVQQAGAQKLQADMKNQDYRLEKMRVENESLQKELNQMKADFRAETKETPAVVGTDKEKEMEELLRTEKAFSRKLEGQLTSLKGVLQQKSTAHRVQLEVRMKEIQRLTAALKASEDKMKSDSHCKKNTPAVCETNKEVDLESSLKTERALTRQLKVQLSDMKDFLQQQSSVHRVQMEVQQAEAQKLQADMKNQDYRLEKIRVENESLQKELNQMKADFRAETKETPAVVGTDKEKEMEELLRTEKAFSRKLEGQLTSLKGVLQQKSTIHRVQLEVRMKEIQKLTAALKASEDKMKSDSHCKKNTPAVCETNKEVDLESSLKTERALTRQLKVQLSDMKDFLQQQSSVHRVQMEVQQAEAQKLQAALKQSEDDMKVQMAAVQTEKDQITAKCLSQVEKLKLSESKLTAALQKAEDELKSLRLKADLKNDFDDRPPSRHQRRMVEPVDFDSKKFKVRDLFLTSLEQQCQAQLKDSEATITRTSTKGRINLDIHDDVLGNMFDWLVEYREPKWDQEKKLMQEEISDLKAQLHKTQADPNQHAPSRDTELDNAQELLQKQQAKIQNQDYWLEKIRVENESLQKELNQTKADLHAAKETPAVVGTDKEKEMEELLRTEKALSRKLEGQLTSLKGVLQQKSTVHRVQLEVRMKEIQRLTAALKASEDKMKSDSHCKKNTPAVCETNKEVDLESYWLEKMRVENESLQKELNQTKADLHAAKETPAVVGTDKEKEMEELLRTEKALSRKLEGQLTSLKGVLQQKSTAHRVQLEVRMKEIQRLTAALKASEDKMKSDSHCKKTDNPASQRQFERNNGRWARQKARQRSERQHSERQHSERVPTSTRTQ